jgi:mRNA-degrading endonuclease RelE of RelBE toxin-antitoxin system
MIFIETDIFTRRLKDLLSDDEYREFQQYLIANPDAGDVITETGGLRKVRWKAGGKGKSGGVRVIYYHLVAKDHLRLLLIYKKGIKDDLTPDEKAVLRKLNERW